MTPDKSIESRPWFVFPTWTGVLPLLIDAIERQTDGADAARAELLQMAKALDDCNTRARNDHNPLHGV